MPQPCRKFGVWGVLCGEHRVVVIVMVMVMVVIVMVIVAVMM